MPARQNTTTSSSSDKSWRSIEKAGDEFDGGEEKPTAQGGTVSPKPEDSLPKYTVPQARPVSPPTFKSSPTAI